jgi:hypothetical protein
MNPGPDLCRNPHGIADFHVVLGKSESWTKITCAQRWTSVRRRRTPKLLVGSIPANVIIAQPGPAGRRVNPEYRDDDQPFYRLSDRREANDDARNDRYRRDDREDDDDRYTQAFSEHDRRIIRGCYSEDYSNLPPVCPSVAEICRRVLSVNCSATVRYLRDYKNVCSHCRNLASDACREFPAAASVWR